MGTTLTQERIDFLARDYCRGFIKYCGLQALEVKKGSFESQVLIGDNHRTQDNFIHAGLMATMADHTAGYSAFTMVHENYRILTIEFKINFLKPAYGNALKCRSKVINKGKQIIVSESKIYDVRDRSEKLAAKAMVTMMAVPAENLAKDRF
jgi:uncharacterized protein (TIGR00369 family)